MNTKLSVIISYAKDRTVIEFWEPKHQNRIILFLRFLFEGLYHYAID